MIVDLAIEDDGESAVFVTEGLAAAPQVDDAQALDAEPYAFAEEEASVVGPPVHHHLRHALEHLSIHGAHDAADAAHGSAHHRLPDRRKPRGDGVVRVCRQNTGAPAGTELGAARGAR